MRKRMVLLLAMILSLAFLMVGLTVGAAADGDVATNTRTGTGYTSLADAISAASSGDTIDVIADTTVSSVITITKQIELTSSSGRTITCTPQNAFTIGVKDGTSGNLTVSGNLILVRNGSQVIQMARGTFTLKDTASITGTFDVINAGSNGTANDVTVNIQGGTVKSTDTTKYTSANNLGSNKGAIFMSTTGAVVNISGGTVEGSGAGAIRFQGSNETHKITGGVVTSLMQTIRAMNSASGTISISGGEVRTTDGNQCVYFYQNDNSKITLNMTGGSLTASGENTIYVNGKTNVADINISGGTVSGTTRVIRINGANNSVTVSGTARVEATATDGVGAIAPNFSTANGDVTINIQGGTVTAPADTIYIQAVGRTAYLNISGGIVEATNASGEGRAIYEATGKAEISISGGTVTSNATAAKSTVCLNTAGSALKIRGGTVQGNARAIQVNASATVEISGGAVTARRNTVYYHTNGAGTLTISGTANIKTDSTITGIDGATNNAIYFNNQNSAAVTMTMTGGSVTADGNSAIYVATNVAEEVDVSGSVGITISGGTLSAAGETILMSSNAENTLAISGGTVAAEGNFAVVGKTGTVNISGGTLTTGGYVVYLQNGSTVTVTGGTLTAGNLAVFAISSPTEETPSSLNISGGIMILNGAGSTHKIISDVYGDGSYCTITVSGGLFVNNNTANRSLFASPVNGTITVTGGKMLYGDNIFYIVQNTVGAPKNAHAVYDANGNGTADAGETYFFYALFAATDNTHTGTMVPGASARLSTGSNGLRFTANYPASAVTALGQDATYGTIILPTTYLVRVSSFTKAALDAANIPYLDIVADDGLIDNGDGTYTVRAAITNILPDNFDLSFSAVSYAKVGDTYYYAAYNTLETSRSINAVASMALADLKTATADGYENAVSTNNRTVYSPYTEAQRAVLDAYLPALPTGTAPLTGTTTLSITHEGNLRGWTVEAGYALGNFNVLQGGATDGTYLYYAMENPSSSDDLTQRLGKIVKVDARNGKVVAIGDDIKLGHAGGVTYNSDLGYLVVAFAKGDAERYVAYVDPVDLTLKKVFTDLPKDAKNIAYISAGTNAGKYIIGDGIYFYVATVSNPLTASESWSFGSKLGGGEATVAQSYADGSTYNLKYSTKNQPGHQSACVSQDGQYVYFAANPYTATFEGNFLSSTHTDDHDYEDYIVIYKISDGSYVGAVRVAATAGETEEYELENVCIIGNQIWLGFHDSFYGEFYHIHTAVVQ